MFYDGVFCIPINEPINQIETRFISLPFQCEKKLKFLLLLFLEIQIDVQHTNYQNTQKNSTKINNFSSFRCSFDMKLNEILIRLKVIILFA